MILNTLKTYAKPLVISALAMSIAACATSPNGRKQITLFSADKVNAMGIQSFEEMKKTQPISQNAAVNKYVQCVANNVIKKVDKSVHSGDWEVVVFESEQVNAFALPGGKIGIYTGILNVAETQHQLAAIIGHEIAHVIANHSNERMSNQTITNAGLSVSQQLLGGTSESTQALAMQALGLGAQYGYVLPYSRSHESEADVIGQELMAQAGFKPVAAIDLWKNMAKQGQAAPPEMLSSHPSNQTRIDGLTSTLKNTQPIYDQVESAGNTPWCIKASL
jgi:predicted Zn-dependent protease